MGSLRLFTDQMTIQLIFEYKVPVHELLFIWAHAAGVSYVSGINAQRSSGHGFSDDHVI